MAQPCQVFSLHERRDGERRGSTNIACAAQAGGWTGGTKIAVGRRTANCNRAQCGRREPAVLFFSLRASLLAHGQRGALSAGRARLYTGFDASAHGNAQPGRRVSPKWHGATAALPRGRPGNPSGSGTPGNTAINVHGLVECPAAGRRTDRAVICPDFVHGRAMRVVLHVFAERGPLTAVFGLGAC